MTRRPDLRAFGATRANWAEAPTPGRVLPFLAPAALPVHPPVALGAGGAAPMAQAEAEGLLARLRGDLLWWPATRAGAAAPAVLIDLRGADDAAAAALIALGGDPGDATALALAAHGSPGARAAAEAGLRVVPSPAHVEPGALRRVIAPRGGALAFHAALGGVGGVTPDGPADPGPWLARARFRDPWTGAETGPEAGLAALALLRAAAQRNDRPVATLGLSRWKRRNAAPFLAGPAGPPRHFADPGAALAFVRREGARLAVWGQAEAPTGCAEPLRLEDGFVRSVGLGLRHAPPASLAVDAEGLYFDATRPTDFERIARETDFAPALLARAAALRARLVELRITKYNLARSAPLPETDRPRLLVPGQVEGDASLRWGSPEVHENAALLRAARARNPGAFLLYKPHPDVLTGLRPGAAPASVIAECADAVAADASAEACLDWADRVETMTSLMGFEALLRGIPVAVHGRPFYAGWGLTEAASAPFDRGRRLSLDALTAAALILYPRYVDPATRLPATPERVLDALDAERAFARTPRGRLRGAWRGAVSWLLNVAG